MNLDYQLMDKQGIRNQDDSNEPFQEFNTLYYFLFLILQLIICIGWACLISYTGFGTLFIDTTTSFAISYSIIGGFSLIALILMKNIKDIYNPNKFILGALFILSNTLFVAYSILGLILNFSSTIYYFQQPEANMWFIYITLGTLLLSFLIIPNRFRQFRWFSIILIPLMYSIIAKYTYNFYDLSFSVWIGIFGAICLIQSEQKKEDYEFFVALDSFGFVLLMVIKVVQYLWNSFFSTNTSSSVLQLQDLDKAKFITYTYIVACVSFLLIPQMAYLISETEIFCTLIYYHYYSINAGLWIFLGVNYLLHLILFLTNRILTIGYKSIIAYTYLTIHIIFVSELQIQLLQSLFQAILVLLLPNYNGVAINDACNCYISSFQQKVLLKYSQPWVVNIITCCIWEFCV
ncbi:hypothetical protein pb186bvf_019191 [Paramecium bursaria]